MKITRIGWVGKNESPFIWGNKSYGLYELDNIFIRKYPKEVWDEENWPPRKVRITVEDEEDK